MRIVPRMIRTLLALSLLTAAPAFAQSSEFGILLGGSKRLIRNSDEAAGLGISDNFNFGNPVKEISYSVALEPGTKFRIKAGQITAPVAFQFNTVEGRVRRDA